MRDMLKDLCTWLLSAPNSHASYETWLHFKARNRRGSYSTTGTAEDGVWGSCRGQVDMTNLDLYSATSDAIQLRPFEVLVQEWALLRKQVRLPGLNLRRCRTHPPAVLMCVLIPTSTTL